MVPVDNQAGPIASVGTPYFKGVKIAVKPWIEKKFEGLRWCRLDGWFAALRSVGACALTPARWDAIRLASHWPTHCGSGGAVADATVLQPLCNRYPSEIIGNIGVVARLHLVASRYARGGGRVHAPTRMCVRIAATMQPLSFAHIYQWVGGCKAVAKRLQLQPAAVAPRSAAFGATQMNILAAGYSARGPGRAIRGNSEGQRPKSFRVFAWAVCRSSSTRCAGQLVRGAKRNGGFLRVSRAVPGPVGMIMLEGCAYPTESRRFSASERKPVRLNGADRAHPGGVDRAAPGAGSPTRATRTGAPWRTRFSENGFRFGCLTRFPGDPDRAGRAKFGTRGRVGVNGARLVVGGGGWGVGGGDRSVQHRDGRAKRGCQ